MAFKDPIRHKTFQCWSSMKQRCLNEKSQSYKSYGGRGIGICEKWINSFFEFVLDMGEKPEGMSLDRIDNNGDYEPSNCRWATPKQQANNRNANVVVEWNGESKTLTEWATFLGVNCVTFLDRYRRGMRGADLLNPGTLTQRKKKSTNKSGFVGASRYRDKWKSQIKIDGCVTYLGLFDTPEEAHTAYLKARDALEEKNK